MEDRELEPAEARIPYATLIFSVASVWIYNDTYTTYIYIYVYIHLIFHNQAAGSISAPGQLQE